jgi:hypothetical protein
LDLIDFCLQKSDWLRNFSLLGFLFTSMMAFSTFKFMWASSIGLEPGFKQHPSGPQVLDLGLGSNKSKQGFKQGLGSNKSNHECTLY